MGQILRTFNDSSPNTANDTHTQRHCQRHTRPFEFLNALDHVNLRTALSFQPQFDVWSAIPALSDQAEADTR
jgi:hypothetical protein